MDAKIGMAKRRRCDLTTVVDDRGRVGVVRARRIAARLDETGVRWLVACVRSGAEFRVMDDLAAVGFRTYAPHGVRVSLRGRVKGTDKRARCERDYPLFVGYVFVGCPPGLLLAKISHESIHAVLGDPLGPGVAPRAIRAINDAHLDGAWDERKRETMRFACGQAVRFVGGALAEFHGIVAELPRPMRAVVEVAIFGRMTKVPVATGQIAAI